MTEAARLDLPYPDTGAVERETLDEREILEVTGLRNRCLQIGSFQEGLLELVVGRADDGTIVRKAGIMGVVQAGGVVRPGDTITVELPAGPHRPLDRV